ncbi:MAG TPA: DNA polymerase III subunit gamma/tau [Chloroflexia bacterium]|nr:DNA polymerase III subunit gamma/tau [Chloroflexia bacterium]
MTSDNNRARTGVPIDASTDQTQPANNSDNASSNRSQTLYRKWRSQTFQELVGQDAITRTLQNAIASGRTGHAYLFCGPRGTGKTSTGRLLAKAVNCLDPDPKARPCDRCEACRSIAEARAMDLIEIDAASNRGIDEIRELRDKINFQPSFLKKKVYIIDEVHMMTEPAFNALLKTLEEPPPHAIFVLATTDPQDVPATVVSRCQRFDFQRISLDQIVGRLQYVCEQENIQADKAALELVARQATGSLRDALSLLDQLIVYSGGNITVEAVRLMLGVMNTEAVADFVDSLIAADMGRGLEQINRLVQAGTDLKRFNRELVEHLRHMMLIKVNPNGKETVDLTAEAYQRLREQAGQIELNTIVNFLKIFSAVDYNLKVSPYGQLPLEIALMESLLQPVVYAQVSAPAQRSYAEAARPAAPVSRPAPVPAQPEVAARKAEPVPIRPEEPKQAPEPVKVVAKESETVVVTDETGETVVLELATVAQAWPQALRSIEAQSKMTAALLREARPASVKGNRVALAFAYSFHRDKINQEATRRNVEDHFSRVIGQRIIIDCVDESGPAGGNSGAAPKAPQPDDRARKRADFFNARILD